MQSKQSVVWAIASGGEAGTALISHTDHTDWRTQSHFTECELPGFLDDYNYRRTHTAIGNQPSATRLSSPVSNAEKINI